MSARPFWPLSTWTLITLSLLTLAACAAPPPPAQAGPEADGGSPPNARARFVIDAQLNAHPDGTGPGLSGEEASVIYRNHLRQIGRPFGGGQQGGSSGSSGSSGQSGAGTPAGTQ